MLTISATFSQYPRNQLIGQVAQIEAQLMTAGRGVKLERAEMESILQRLSSALADVDEELTQLTVRIEATL